MRTKISLILIILALAASSLACSLFVGDVDISFRSVRGNGRVSEETRNVGDFHAVSVNNQGNLYIAVGEIASLRVEAEANLLEYIETDVRSGDLVFETRRTTNLRNTEPINYYLTVTPGQLEAIRIHSSGDVTSEALSAEQFEIQVSSSGDLRLQGLQADHLEMRISSSGDVWVEGGSVDRQNISISSSGNYDAADLQSSVTEANLSSSGSATVSVSERLNANLSSSGDLNYYGSPQVQQHESSSGRVHQR